MQVVRHATAAEFLDVAGPRLRQAEVENNLILGIASTLAAQGQRHDGQPYLMTVHGDRVAAAALITPPRKLVITRSTPEVIQCLADYLDQAEAPVPGVIGPAPEAERFARHWTQRSATTYRLDMKQRVYQCHRVAGPASSPGGLRAAVAADQPLLVPWCEQFNRDVGITVEEDAETLVQDAIAGERLFVWDHRQPVSMAAWTRETTRGVAVNLVYTPLQLRRKGYASSCVAALSERLLQSGKAYCVLHADLANPTSNSIYQKIGYRPVCAYQEWSFH